MSRNVLVVARLHLVVARLPWLLLGYSVTKVCTRPHQTISPHEKVGSWTIIDHAYECHVTWYWPKCAVRRLGLGMTKPLLLG